VVAGDSAAVAGFDAGGVFLVRHRISGCLLAGKVMQVQRDFLYLPSAFAVPAG